MSQILRKLMSTYMNEADAGEGGGSGGSGETITDAAAAEAAAIAAKEAAEAEAAKKSKVTDAEAKLLKEVMDKKTALKRTTEELEKIKETMKELESFGGVEALKTLAQQQKDLEAKKLEEKGEWTRLKQQMNEEHEKTLKEKLEAIELASGENKKLMNQISELTVGNAFASSSFIKESLVIPLKKVRVLYGDHFEFKDGTVVAYDKPAGSDERTMLVDAKGEPLNFDLAMAKIIDADPDREHLLKSKTKPGAGSLTAAKTKPAAELDKPHGAARISAALAKGGLK